MTLHSSEQIAQEIQGMKTHSHVYLGSTAFYFLSWMMATGLYKLVQSICKCFLTLDCVSRKNTESLLRSMKHQARPELQLECGKATVCHGPAQASLCQPPLRPTPCEEWELQGSWGTRGSSRGAERTPWKYMKQHRAGVGQLTLNTLLA